MSSTPTVTGGALRRPTPRRLPYRIKCKRAPKLRVTVLVPHCGVYPVGLVPRGASVVKITRRMRITCPGCELDVVVDEGDAYSAAVGHAQRCPGLARLNRPFMVACWGCDGTFDHCIICDGRGWMPR